MDKNPENYRQKVIDAGCDLFTRIGYNETTVGMIMERSGLDKYSFYYLFESKEALLNDVVRQMAESEIAVFERISGEYTDPLGKLTAMLNEMLSFRRARELMIGLVKKRCVVVNYMFKEHVMEKAVPLMESVITEGVLSGRMHTQEPAQTALLILNNMVLVLSGLFVSGCDEKVKLLRAFFQMTEASLGLEPGTLDIENGCLEMAAE